MTREEFEKSWEYRVYKKEMFKKFPFIVDFVFPDSWEKDWEEYEMCVFLDAIVSDSEIRELYPDWGIWNFQKNRFEENGGRMNNLVYLGELYFSGGGPEDLPSEVTNEIRESSTGIHWTLQRNSAVPDEMKLPRSIALSTFNIVP